MADAPVPLIDPFDRRVKDLRISITDRCNFRCTYCMPVEGMQWLPREELLTYEEQARIARVCVERFGFEAIRITGGEPTLRAHLPRLIAMLAPLDVDVALTSNGVKLPEMAHDLAAAGLRRINVSLDSLQRDRFFRITRRDALPRVLAGLEALAAEPRIRPVKINALGIRGFTEEEVLPFCDLARSSGFQVRFIEFMPLDADRAWEPDAVLTGEEIRAQIETRHRLVPLSRKRSATARVFRFADGRGTVGFVNPVTEPFCADCDRIRLTADGKLRTCLFSLSETDLLGPMRDGASDEELEETIRRAVWRKELKHRINEPGFVQPERTMSAIGG